MGPTALTRQPTEAGKKKGGCDAAEQTGALNYMPDLQPWPNGHLPLLFNTHPSKDRVCFLSGRI